MDFSEKHIQFLNTQLLKYLDKNYLVKEGKFFTTHDDVHEWGRRITDSLETIFSIDLEHCENVFKHWAYGQGMSSREFELAWGSRKLKAEWSPEMVMDLQAMHGIEDAEAQLTAILSQQIAAEIDAEILRELSGNIKTNNELISLVKCIGYEPTDVVYDVATFKPKRGFKSMNHNDIINERNINTHWKDWVQSREQIKKT